MAYKPRTPNIEKSVKARTTGNIKRQIKRNTNPTYGKKGVGFVKDPENSINDSIYHQTTYSIYENSNNKQNDNSDNSLFVWIGTIIAVVIALALSWNFVNWLFSL